MVCDRQVAHLSVGDLYILLIALVNELCSHGEAGCGRGGADRVERGLVGVEGSSRPVLADLAEQSMFDRVPLGCARRVVGDRHTEAVALGELLLQAMLPRPTTGPVAAAAVRQDREFFGMGVSLSGFVDPPGLDGVDREGGRVSRGPDVEGPALAWRS